MKYRITFKSTDEAAQIIEITQEGQTPLQALAKIEQLLFDLNCDIDLLEEISDSIEELIDLKKVERVVMGDYENGFTLTMIQV